MGKKAKEPEKPSTAWQGTYGDMITLMLCFFVMLYNPSEVDVTQLATITQSLQMQETESTSGGMSLSAGQLSDLGNNINSLPSIEKGKSLGLAKKKAVSLFDDNLNSILNILQSGILMKLYFLDKVYKELTNILLLTYKKEKKTAQIDIFPK